LHSSAVIISLLKILVAAIKSKAHFEINYGINLFSDLRIDNTNKKQVNVKENIE